jgi:hypothetical protein
MQNASYRQILPAHDDDIPVSGVRERRPMPAPTLIEHLGVRHLTTANDAAAPSTLINAGAHNSTSYRFIAPRLGRRR